MPTIHQLARQICEDLGWPEYHVLAKELARLADQIDDPYAALVPYAYHFLRNPGSWPRPGASTGSVSPISPGAEGTGGVAAASSGVSSRVSLVRDTWPVLRLDYAVGDGERRSLLDCDAADLDYAARNLQGVADRTRERAALLARLRDELAAHSVTRVHELPDTVLDSYSRQLRP